MIYAPSLLWQSAVAMPEQGEAENIAERLVLLAHYGVDFSVWGGKRRKRYWDALAERVKASTYAGPTLSDWWTALCISLPSAVRNSSERNDVVDLLGYKNPKEVLKVLRNNPEVVVLRVRVISEYRREMRDEEKEL
jgi:hypothetical protein